MPEWGDDAQGLRRALQDIRLFSDVLSSEALDRLALECRPRAFVAGSTLMVQGEIGASMFCIVEGAVSITYVDPEKRSNAIRELAAGSVVGEIELLTGERRIATVTAVTNVRALEISEPALTAILRSTPELIEGFSATLTIRRELLQQIVSGRGGSLKARLKRLIGRVPTGGGGARG